MKVFSGYQGTATLVSIAGEECFIVARNTAALGRIIIEVLPEATYDPNLCRPALLISPEVIKKESGS